MTGAQIQRELIDPTPSMVVAEPPNLLPPDPNVEPSTSSRVVAWIIVGVAALAVLALVAAAGATIERARATAPFDPIEFSPTPRHVERIDGEGAVTVPTLPGLVGPAVRLGSTIPTTGLRCVDAPEPVDVLSSVWWEQTGTNVRIKIVDQYPAVLQPGCFPLRFENVIPAEVAEIVRSRRAPTQWTISGSATPVAAGGVPANWRIEPVWIEG